MSFTLFNLTDNLSISFKADAFAMTFAVLVLVVVACIGVFAYGYFEEKEMKKKFFVWYLIAAVVLVALSFAANIITYYFFFELLTLSTFPLVLAERSKESVLAALKYLFYSMFGAYNVLFGLFFVIKYADKSEFTTGGVFTAATLSEHGTLLLVCAFCMLIGFGVKAGMFPLHAWLPTAHPVAPCPASSMLSGIIVKAGIVGMIRVVYQVFGCDFLSGTWVQTTVIILSIITIFVGSMVALKEENLKKRLAYSTVSNLSYIVFGFMLFNKMAFAGAILQLVGHALCKSALFLCSGSFMHMGIRNVTDLNGIGKKMPYTMAGFTVASLGLIGIPPTAGFVAKWYLGSGAVASGVAYLGYIGPIMLIISALLTAGYLLPIVRKGYFAEGEVAQKASDAHEGGVMLTAPVLTLSLLAVAVGIVPVIALKCLNIFF